MTYLQKEKSVLGVDIGSSSLRRLYSYARKADKRSSRRTANSLIYGGGEIGQATNLSAEQIHRDMKDLLREAGNDENCGVSIPFARSLLTPETITLSRRPERAKTVIELEARKYIPCP